MGCVCVDYWSAATFHFLSSPLEAHIRTDESYLTHWSPVLSLYSERPNDFAVARVEQIMAEMVESAHSFFSLNGKPSPDGRSNLAVGLPTEQAHLHPLSARFDNEQWDWGQV